jgi:hypothetical protein
MTEQKPFPPKRTPEGRIVGCQRMSPTAPGENLDFEIGQNFDHPVKFVHGIIVVVAMGGRANVPGTLAGM